MKNVHLDLICNKWSNGSCGTSRGHANAMNRVLVKLVDDILEGVQPMWENRNGYLDSIQKRQNPVAKPTRWITAITLQARPI